MSTITAPAAPASVAQAPQPAPAVDHTATFRNDAAKAAPDALNALLGGKKPSAPAPAPVAPAPVPPTPQPVAPVAATPVTPVVAPVVPAPATTPAVVAPEPPTPQTEEEHRLAKNWRMTARDPKEAMFFQELKTKPPEEAYESVYGRKPDPTQPAPATPTPDPTPEPSPTAEVDNQLSALSQQATQLATDLDKAIKDGDTVTALSLQEKKFDLKLKAARLEDQRASTLRDAENARVDAVVTTYQRTQTASAAAAVKEYPELGEESSAKRAAFNLRVRELRQDPANQPFFDSPNWPLLVARVTAAEQGWTKGSAAPVPAAPLEPSPQPAAPAPATRATAAEIVTPASPSNGTTFAPTVEQFKADAHRFTPDALNKLLAAPVQKQFVARR